MPNPYLIVALFLSALLLACVPAHANVAVSNVTSVYDADTFRVEITGWTPLVGNDMPIRVAGIDAPEIRGKCAKEKRLAQLARRHTIDMLASGTQVELRNVQRGKYYRLVANVYIDGESLAQSLLDEGLAVRYTGRGIKKDWCN